MNRRRCCRNYYKYRQRDEITIEEVYHILNNNSNAVLLDVRSNQEYNEGHLQGSINIPLYDLGIYIDDILLDTDTYIVTYCQSGMRSKEAIEILRKKGYKNVYSLDGGLNNVY